MKSNQNKKSIWSQQKVRTGAIVKRAAFIESLEPRQLLAAWSAQDTIIGLDKATQNFPSITGAGETVVLIDQGVDYNHPALGGGFGNKIVDSWNFDTGSWDVFPYDNNSHGTGSASELGGNQRVVNGQIYQGIAPGVKIVALKASGSWNVKQAFDWVIAHRAQDNIVAVNWVDPTGGSDFNTFTSELNTLNAQGVFVGGPTGNYGPSPAYATPANTYFQAGSSNLWGGISSFTPTGSGENLVAPAENVDVAWYYNGIHAELPSSGTSWAGPQMVGAAALIKQINPYFSPAQIMQIMRDSATWIYDSSGNAYPQLNVNGALTLAYQRSGQSAAPVVTAPAPAPVATPAPVALARSAAFKGTPFAAGSPILAAYYDVGGQNVGYHTTSNWNESGNNTFRPGDYVGVGWTNSDGGSAFVGWTHPSQWLSYSVNAAYSGSYSFQGRVADAGSGASFHVEIDGKAVTGSIAVNNTGAWDNYGTVSASGIYVAAGQHTVHVVMDSSDQWGFSGNYTTFNLTPGGTAAATPPAAATPAAATGSAPATPVGLSVFAGSMNRNMLAFYDNSNNETGFVVERADFVGGVYNAVATIASDGNSSPGTGWRYYTDSGVRSGSTYYYRLHAINQAGSSGYLYATVTAA